MTKRLLTSLLTMLLIVGVSTNAEAQRKKKKEEKEEVPAAPKTKKGEIQFGGGFIPILQTKPLVLLRIVIRRKFR